MKIQTVKISGQGYAVDYGDGVIWSVSVDGCGYDKVLKWIEEGNTPEPEFTEDELVRLELNRKISEALTFLAKTDNREFPSYIPKDGENIAETIAKRVEARQFIRENR